VPKFIFSIKRIEFFLRDRMILFFFSGKLKDLRS